jgi:ABC-type glycerol-3-phosphate transport system substrate-binding protein
VCGLAAGACGASTSSGQPAAGAPAATTPGRAVTQAPATAVNVQGTVSVLSYQQTSPRYDMQQANYDAFNTEYASKGLRVDFVNPGPMANDLLLQKFITLHVAGTPMDVMEWPLLWRQLEGIVTELTPYLKRDKIDEQQWIPNAISAMKDDQGRIWGSPVSISTDALAYNLDLLDAAGIKPPPMDPDDRSWSMDAFLENAKKLTKGTEQFGMEGKFTGGVDWLTWPGWFGYGAVDLPNKKLTINASGYAGALQYWIDLTNRYHVAPTADELAPLRATPSQDSFLTGKIAYKGIFNLAEKPPFRWGLAAMPYTASSGEPKNIAGRIDVHALFVDGASKNKDQAWEVLKYWMRPDTDQKYVLSDGHVVAPIVKSGSAATLKDFQDRMGVDPKAFLQMGQRTRLPGWGYYLLKNWGAARTEIDTLFTEAKAGRMAVPEFVQKAQDLSLQMASF